MEATRTRAFGPARIVALALISVAALGLAYLHFGTGSDPLSVPSGTDAGQLKLHPCQYATENGSYRADCGTLVVPENRHKAHSRLIALPVIRILARSAKPAAPVFRLEGGPGLTNMNFPDASRFAGHHDLVLVGYRGVDGSSKLGCPEVISAREHARDFLSEESFRADAAAFKACAHRLQRGRRRPGRLHASRTRRRPRRGSPGARLSAHRPSQRERGDAHGADLRLALPGAHPALGADRRQPARWLSLGRADDGRADSPLRRPLRAGLVLPEPYAGPRGLHSTRPSSIFRGASGSCRSRTGAAATTAFWGLMQATSAAEPISAPMTIDTLLSASRGDGSGSWFLALMGQLAFPTAQVWGDVAAVGRTDAAYAQRFFATHADRGSVIGAPGTDFVWAGGKLLGSWPASPDENQYTHVPDSKVETLLIGGNVDFATPPQNATRALLPHLPNGHQVILADLGHTDDFWAYQPAASGHLVNTFFDSGRVDASRLHPESDRLRARHKSGRDREDRPRRDARAGGADGVLAALVAAPPAPARIVRTGRRAVLYGLLSPLLFGLGGWFTGSARRADGAASCSHHRRAAGGSLGGPADRAGHLLRLGEP